MKVHTPRLRAIDFSKLDFNAAATPVASVSTMLCRRGPKMLKPRRRLNDLTWFFFFTSLKFAQIEMGAKRVSAEADVQ